MSPYITKSKIIKTALERVLEVRALGQRLQRSANVQDILENLDKDEAKRLADASFEWPGPKPTDIFDAGCDLGRLAKQQIVTWAVVAGKYYYYFIGPEAQVLRKLQAATTPATTGDNGDQT